MCNCNYSKVQLIDQKANLRVPLMLRAIILPLPVGIAAKRVWDNKLLIWCGDTGGMPPRGRGPPARGPGGPRSPRFTGRPSWHANKGTDIAWLLVDGIGGRGGMAMDPMGAAPGGRSFWRAPTGGLRGWIAALLALGITGGGGGKLRLLLLLGGVALLLRSLSLTEVVVQGGRGPKVIGEECGEGEGLRGVWAPGATGIRGGGVVTALTLPLLLGVDVGTFMTMNWNKKYKGVINVCHGIEKFSLLAFVFILWIYIFPNKYCI